MSRGRQGSRRARAEAGSISVLVLGFAVVAILLVLGTVAVTSVQLARMRLLDVADGAALEAANSVDDTVYARGLHEAVPLSSRGVRQSASAYLGRTPRPPGVLAWSLAPGTGCPDAETAVVRITGRVEVPVVGALLSVTGGSVTITVESRARADLG